MAAHNAMAAIGQTHVKMDRPCRVCKRVPPDGFRVYRVADRDYICDSCASVRRYKSPWPDPDAKEWHLALGTHTPATPASPTWVMHGVDLV